MTSNTPEYRALQAAVTERLNAHDLLGVMDLGVSEDEYDPEMRDFVQLMRAGVTITPEVVATVWHKWFGTGDGGPAGGVDPATSGMEALASDLEACRQNWLRGRFRVGPPQD